MWIIFNRYKVNLILLIPKNNPLVINKYKTIAASAASIAQTINMPAMVINNYPFHNFKYNI